MAFYCRMHGGECDGCQDCMDTLPGAESCALCGEERTVDRLSDGLCRDCRREAEKKLADFLRGLSEEELAHLDCAIDGVYMSDWLESRNAKPELRMAAGL